MKNSTKTPMHEGLLRVRQSMRDQKAMHLRDYRRYKQMLGTNDYLTGFMKGMAAAIDPCLIRVNSLLAMEEIRNEQ